PTNKKMDFPKLLKKINEIPGDFWIRFTSSHPKNFSDELIDVMAQRNHITEYLNLPIQSGDDEILKKMNRPYTVSKYKKIIHKIRKKIPDISLSTDVIIGFPGETKTKFQNTQKTFEEIGFDMAYILKYSKRPQTKAKDFEDQIDKKTKEERYRQLTTIVGKAGLKKNLQYEGQVLKILISNERNGFLIGKTRHYKTVKLKGDKSLIGKFIDVKIKKALAWGLRGELVIKKPKMIVILGPTATGKTDLSVKLAKKFNGEIISADSRQTYKGMDIGSGKITKKEMKGIPHHLLDVANPKKRFSLAEYKQLADKAIEKIIRKNKIPFLVGGTGFYIQAVADNVIIPEVAPDWTLRKILEGLTTKELFSLLKKRDSIRASNIDRNNRRRLIRALEIALKTKMAIPQLQSQPNFKVLMIGINKSSEKLKKLIQKRLEKRLKKGMVAEVKKLKKQGLSWKRLEEFGLEYKLVAQYLQNKISKEKMIERIQIESSQYAKKQMTWFKRDKRIKWVKNQKEANSLITIFLLNL
ncbi:MAG: tRNA (adenosine(37)-N6)-dimethylallyltransferase MiaA, partial [Patescibacteria group bacterium]